MNGWLPRDFQDDRMAERAGRAVVAVRDKVARRRRIIRATQWAGAAAAAAVLAFALAPRLTRQESTAPSPVPMASKVETVSPDRSVRPTGFDGPDRSVRPTELDGRPGAPARPSPVRAPKPPGQIGLAKSGAGVRLTWEGDADAEYVVYRCTSPRFDTCAVAGEVRGTQWSDREANTAPLVFYKVEPRT